MKDKIELNGFVRRVSEEVLIIDAVSGELTLEEKESDGFLVYDDGDRTRRVLRSMPADIRATEQTPADVYELVKGGDYAEIFPSDMDMKDFCFTQHQVIRFMEKYAFRMVNYDTITILFLASGKGDVFVVKISARDQYYVLKVSPLDSAMYVFYWPNSETCTHFIIPKKNRVCCEHAVLAENVQHEYFA